MNRLQQRYATRIFIIYLVIRRYTLSIALFLIRSDPPGGFSVCVHLSHILLIAFFLTGSDASFESFFSLLLVSHSLRNGSPKFKTFGMYCWRTHSLFIPAEITHLTNRHLLQLFLVVLSIRHKTLFFVHAVLQVQGY